MLCTLLLWIAGCQKKPTLEQILVNTSQASIPCIDTLAAAKYPQVLDAVPLHFAISGFAQTFGDFFPVAKQELDRGRRHIRVNLLWSDTHTYGNKDIASITKEAKRYQILCANYPNSRIELAPFTEHNLKEPDKYLNIAKINAPNCGIVNSVWKGALSKVYKNEVHGTNTKPNTPYNYSYDGTNSVDSNVRAMRRRHANAELFCMWHPRLNGKWSMTDTTPRPDRSAWPTKELLQSLVYLFTEKGKTRLPKTWLVKSHSEKHNVFDFKGDKLLIISPLKAPSITLKAGNITIASLPFYGDFSGGGFRYYGNNFAYKYSEQARALNASPLVKVYIGNKRYGRVNPAFRDKVFR